MSMGSERKKTFRGKFLASLDEICDFGAEGGVTVLCTVGCSTLR